MNLPNKLSLLRIFMVPLFIVAYFLPFSWGAYVAVAIFILAAFTDFLDGYIARKYNMVTDLGKLLDPIADKMLVCAALFVVVATNPLQYYVSSGLIEFSRFGVIFLSVGGAIILSRELLVSAVRMIAATNGVVVQANKLGKVKTVLQDVSLPILVILNAQQYDVFGKTFYNVMCLFSMVLFGAAVLMTIVSGVVYVVQNRKVFAEND